MDQIVVQEDRDAITPISRAPEANQAILIEYARRATGAKVPSSPEQAPSTGAPERDISSTAGSEDGPANAGLQKVQDLFEVVRRESRRDVDRDLAAEVAMAARNYARAGDFKASNTDVMKAVNEDMILRWYRAQGLSDADIKGLRSASFNSGWGAPASTFVSNALNYMVAPALTAATESSWVGAGVGLAANLLQPWLVAVQQSGFKTLNDWIAVSSGHTVKADKAINHKQRPQDISAALVTDVENTLDAMNAFNARFADVMGISDDLPVVPGAFPAALPLTTIVTAVQVMRRLDQNDLWEEFEALKAGYETCQAEMFEKQRDLFMTQGVHQKHEEGHRLQFWPRMLRSPVSTLVGLGSGVTAEQIAAAETVALANQAVHRRETLSAGASVGIQCGLALALFGGQMFAAAWDEYHRQEYINKLNLVYGDYFTEEGARKDRAGETLTAADIDENKLRSYLSASKPAQVRLIQSIVAGCREEAEAKRDVLLQRAQSSAPPLTPSQLERGPEPEIEESTDALRELDELIADFRAQEQAIAALDSSRLDPGSMAAVMLKAVSEGRSWRLLYRSILAKYKKKGETSVQAAQRLGQGLHLLLFGSFAAGSIGKVSGAVVGGAKYASNAQIGSVAAAGAVMGGVGAYYQSDALNIKDNRRAGETDMGFWEQVARGMAAAPISWAAAVSAAMANMKMKNALLQIRDAERSLALYKEALALKEGNVPVAADDAPGPASFGAPPIRPAGRP